MHALKSVVISLLPLLVIITGLCGLVAVVMQQSYRQAANDPQIELAQAAAKLLTLDVAPAVIIPPDARTVDIDTSLSPWLIIYDPHGGPVASSARLHNGVPHVPDGVFAEVSKNGEDRITWQPERGVRQAIVVVGAGEKGFAVAGRNLREVENRERKLWLIVLAAWFVLMVGIITFTYAIARNKMRR